MLWVGGSQGIFFYFLLSDFGGFFGSVEQTVTGLGVFSFSIPCFRLECLQILEWSFFVTELNWTKCMLGKNSSWNFCLDLDWGCFFGLDNIFLENSNPWIWQCLVNCVYLSIWLVNEMFGWNMQGTCVKLLHVSFVGFGHVCWLVKPLQLHLLPFFFQCRMKYLRGSRNNLLNRSSKSIFEGLCLRK